MVLLSDLLNLCKSPVYVTMPSLTMMMMMMMMMMMK